jgi:succinate dehydrogenase flavin-adding protein (antitoxin of CptAB toxin-antitoxin module)
MNMDFDSALTYIAESVIEHRKYMGIKLSMFLNPTDDEMVDWLFGPQESRNAVKEQIEQEIKDYVRDEYPELAWGLVREWDEEQKTAMAEAI